MRTSLFFLLLLLFDANSAAQELVGTDHILPGSLASFEIVPAQEASWHITPSSDNGIFQVDTGLSKIYFASPMPGQYTVIAGIVADGKPQLLVKTFDNGEEEVRPLPVPTPTPVPVPPVSSLETWIKTQVPVLVKSEHLVAGSRIVAECFEQIVRRIDEGNIKTAQNAQAQVQIALTVALALASQNAVNDWTPFLTELGQRLETELDGKLNDLAEVKKTFLIVSSAMKSLELPQGVLAPLQDIDALPQRGTQNHIFRNLLTK